MPRKDGTPTIAEMIHDDDDEPYDPREGKTWPPEEDCTHCPGHKNGPHKFSCGKGGNTQVSFSVNLTSDTEVEIK